MFTWATVADVKRALGLTSADTADDEWLAQVTGAANAWANRRRADAGYPPPDAGTIALDDQDVAQGVVYLAVWAYRTRGTAGDRTASFAEFGGWSTMPADQTKLVNDFLGIPRPVAV